MMQTDDLHVPETPCSNKPGAACTLKTTCAKQKERRENAVLSEINTA